MVANHSHSPPSPLDHQHSDGGIRKRVCKACDRCRLKKSKCDGSSPCSRCKADNAICFFGERKKSHDKVYPKGYVEMLEQQQGQLINALQELYKRTIKGDGWPGAPLSENNNGHPHIHDILDRLGALTHDAHGESELFEEDTNALQQRLLANGAGLMQRTDSLEGSESPKSSIFENAPTNHMSFASNVSLNTNFPPTPPDNHIFNYNPQQNVSAFHVPQNQSNRVQTPLPQSMYQPQRWTQANDMASCPPEMSTPLPLPMVMNDPLTSPQYLNDLASMGTINPNCLPLWSDDDLFRG